MTQRQPAAEKIPVQVSFRTTMSCKACKISKQCALACGMGYSTCMGTGMIAGSSTFRAHLEMENTDLFCMLHVVLHGTEALVHNNQREAAAPTCLHVGENYTYVFKPCTASVKYF